MELFGKILNGFRKYYAGVFLLIKLLEALKKGTPVQVFSCEFCEIFKSISGGCFWTFTLYSYILSLLFLTFSISPFRSSHRKYSIKKAVLKVLNMYRKTPMLESPFNKVQGWRPATLLKRDSNAVVFPQILLFTNSYRITCVLPSVLIFLVKIITKEKM